VEWEVGSSGRWIVEVRVGGGVAEGEWEVWVVEVGSGWRWW